jgi:hypothetical protein
MNRAENKNSILRKARFYRYLLLLIMLGAAVYIFLPRITTLESSINVLQSMSVWIFGLAVIAEVGSYLGSGYLLKTIMSLGKSRFSVFRGALITLAAASMGLLMGGWVTSLATTYYWVSKDEDIAEESRLLGFLPALYNNTILITLAAAGFLNLLMLHDLSDLQILIFSLILSFYGLLALVIILGFRYRDKVEMLVLWIVNYFSRLLKHPYESTSVHDVFDNIYTGLLLLRKKGWIKPAFGSCLNIGFDMLALYLIFIAAGQLINPVVLIAGYSMAFLLGVSAFFIPGGVGVVESGLVAVYASLGVPVSVSIVAILSYRLLSFWLPLIIGFVVNGYLGRKIRRNISQE